VLIGAVSIVGGLGAGALAVYQYRDRHAIYDAERHVLGRSWTRDWHFYWAVRRADPVIGSIVMAAASLALIVNGIMYLSR
jgi:hypothetical protein